MSNKQICGYISLLYSIAEKPLNLWSKHVSLGGKIHRVKDDTLHGDKVIELIGSQDSALFTNISSPATILDVLNIKLPILVLVIKNLNLRFKLEFQIKDKKQYRRRFSFMTYNLEKLPNVDMNMACIPLKLEESWNFLEINLQALCHKIYGTDYEALQRIIVYPNCRLRRIYLQDRHYEHDETPIEMFQAFFDMYMLKRGINLNERACQTEEYHTGFSERSVTNCIAKNSIINVSSTRNNTFSNMYNVRKLKNRNAISAMANLCNSNTSKSDYISLNTFNNQARIYNNQNVSTRQSQFFNTNFLQDMPIIENKIQKSNNNITDDKGEPSTTEMYKEKSFHNACNFNSNILINGKINNQMLQPAASVELKGIERSEFLKMHVDKVFKHNRFTKRPYSSQNQSSRTTYINSNSVLSNSSNNIQVKETNINSIVSKSEISTINFLSTSKPDQSGKKFNYNKINQNMNDSHNDQMQCGIVAKAYKGKRVKQNERNTKDLISTVNDTKIENIKNIFERIPSLIEKEAKLEGTKSQRIYLTDKAIFDFIDTCHSVNGKLFEKLRDKGFNMTQVMLSIYNATNRKNSHEQEKFIKKQKWCVNKSTSLHQI